MVFCGDSTSAVHLKEKIVCVANEMFPLDNVFLVAVRGMRLHRYKPPVVLSVRSVISLLRSNAALSCEKFGLSLK